MAESVRRRSWGGVLPLGRHASISGSSLIHCASVSMAPPRPRGAKRPSSQPVQARTGPSVAADPILMDAAEAVSVKVVDPVVEPEEAADIDLGYLHLYDTAL